MQQWQLHRQQQASSSEQQERCQLRRLVLLPAGHAASTLHVACRVHFERLLQSTFCDTDVFCLCAQPSHTVLDNLRSAQPRWIRQAVGWTLHWKRSVPYAYILPKEESKHFMKASPIVSYTSTWITPLGNLLSMALNAIAQTVFAQDDFLATVPSILRAAWKVMRSLHLHSDLTLEQQDIAGFYNAVPHFRILQAVQILVARFRDIQLDLQQLADPNSFLSVSTQSATRLTRAFRGTWKRLRHCVSKLRIRLIVPLVQYFLQRSYFTVGRHVFRQDKGASMGSPCAPILCGCIAAVQELLLPGCF